MHSIVFIGCSILSQRRQCTLKIVQELFTLTQRHSHALNHIQGVFTLIQRHSHALNPVQGLFNSHSKAFFLMVTPQWVAFNNHSMAFRRTQLCSGAVHTHSMAFTCTQWCSGVVNTQMHSRTLNVVQGLFNTHSKAFTSTLYHSGGVQYSLKGIQPVQILKSLMNMFSNMQSMLRPYKFALNFHWMLFNLPFLGICQKKSEISWRHTWIDW